MIIRQCIFAGDMALRGKTTGHNGQALLRFLRPEIYDETESDGAVIIYVFQSRYCSSVSR